jgi:hypothetical protein
VARHRPTIQTNRAEVAIDKKSPLTRTNRAQVVGTNGPNSPIWKTTPEVESAGTKVVGVGTALEEAEARVQATQSELDTAVNTRDAKVKEFDGVYDVYVALAESRATKPQDITGLGLALLTRSSYALAAPLGVEAVYNVIKERIRIHVNKTPGTYACVVEISQNPHDPASWKRLPGIGAVHNLSGYAPGTYWVRAASARANEVSEFTGPVAVIVK